MTAPETIPSAIEFMRAWSQWVVWDLRPSESDTAKLIKTPINPATGLPCNAHDPARWMDYETAARIANGLGGSHGAGFVFTASDPFFFVDIDHAKLPSGEWNDLAKRVLGMFPGAAVEVSQSGEGLHIFGWTSQRVEHSNRRPDLGLELYFENRFCANTHLWEPGGAILNHTDQYMAFAEWFPPKPKTDAIGWVDEAVPAWSGPDDDEALIAKMLGAADSPAAVLGQTATFRQLWEADAGALARVYPDSDPSRAFDYSAADLALCGKLAFWTGKNSARMDRLVRRSQLVREKWENRDDYRKRTIGEAIADCKNVYSDTKPLEDYARVCRRLSASGAGAPCESKPLSHRKLLEAGGNTPKVDSEGTGTFRQNAVNIDVTGETPEEFRFYAGRSQGSAIADQIPEAAAYLARDSNIAVGQDGLLYRYRQGRYQPDGERWVSFRLRAMLKEHFRKKHVSEALAWFRADEAMITERPPADVINVANGLLEWRAPSLRSHSPAHYSSVQIPIRWCSEATCPQIDRVLGEILPMEVVPLIHEIAGLCLYPANPMRKAFMFLGQGRNGKSTVLNLIRAMLGSENCSSIPIQTLSENRFAPAGLFGKLANIAGDIDARSIGHTDVFKCWTGGDEIRAEHKGRNAFSFRPFATPLFSANEAPLSSDQTDGWFDRWIVIDFDRRIADEEVDPHLEAALHAPGELEGFLVHAVEGLRRLMARGHFELPDVVSEAGSSYRLRLDSVLAFIDEQCTLANPGSWTTRIALYAAYRSWCLSNGRRPVSSTTMIGHIRNGFSGRIVEHKRNGTRGWMGITLPGDGVSASHGF